MFPVKDDAISPQVTWGNKVPRDRKYTKIEIFFTKKNLF